MGPERRATPRRPASLPAGLRLTVPEANGKSRALMAKLIDVSEGGVGIETFAHIPSGMVVEIEGNWRKPDLTLRFGGRARVAHISEIERGRYRIGLQLLNVALARTA